MSGSIGDAINGIVETAIKKNPPENGDYIGDDGLLYCGKCHTRRQFKMKWLDGQDRLFPVPCKCREEEAQRQKELEAKRKEMERIASLKKNSLMDKKFESSTFADIVVTPDNRKQIKLARRYADKFNELYEKNQGLTDHLSMPVLVSVGSMTAKTNTFPMSLLLRLSLTTLQMSSRHKTILGNQHLLKHSSVNY